MAEYEGEGVYRIGKAERIWSCRKAVMEDAVAPVEPGIPPEGVRFGWFKGGIPTPASGGFYVVEFLDNARVCVLAYIDMYGRAFTTRTGFERPPAQAEDMVFMRTDDHPSQADGVILARDASGSLVQCATTQKFGSGQNAKYTILNSWYDFGSHGKRLHYYDLMTRAYLAFVYRATLGNALPPFGIAETYQVLANGGALPAFQSVIKRTRAAQADAQMTVHPLVERLAGRLAACKVDELAARPEADEAVRMVRTVPYADTFFLIPTDPEFSLEEAVLWQMEAAVNLFSLSESALSLMQSKGSIVSLDACEEFLMEGVGTQTVSLELSTEMPSGASGGEWEARSAIAAGIEHMALPLRVETQFTLDLPKGSVTFSAKVPDAQLVADLFGMKREDAQERARRYAMRIALLLADVGFRSSSAIQTVTVATTSLDRGASSEVDAASAASTSELSAAFSVTLSREQHQRTEGFKQARSDDPLPFFEEAGATFGMMDAGPSLVDADEVVVLESDPMQDLDAPLSPAMQHVFAAIDRRGMQVNFAVDLRRLAERIADGIAGATGASDALHRIRAIQEEAADQGGTGNDVQAAFTRVMTAIADGSLSFDDQNATVSCFLGEDGLLAAVAQAKQLSERDDQEEAVRVLGEALAAADASQLYADTSSVVYRAFDSYASRLLYNLIKEGRFSFAEDNAAFRDAGRTTRLMPDSYYFCLLELADSLEGSFDRSEEAIQAAQRAVEVAPTIAMGYRVLARSHMLVGDMASAQHVLQDGLRVVCDPDEAASAYYQLAYVLWKSGDPRLGAACYAKSLMCSSLMAQACVAELKALHEETGITPPDREDVDRILTDGDIVCAPTGEVVEALAQGAVAAMDEGLSHVAEGLLSAVYFQKRDDALMNMLRSL